MSESHNKPAARLYLHPIQVTIWRNDGRDGNAFFSAVFERRYKDKDGKWAGTASIAADELLLLAKAADRAHDEILKLRVAERQASETADISAA